MRNNLEQIKTFVKAYRRIIIIAALLIFSLINPLVFNYYYGNHEKLSETSYILQDTKKYGPEYYVHARFLYEGYKNLKLGRFNTLSIIDESNPLFSFPHFQFYNIGPSFILAVANFYFQDPINSYIFGIWLATFLYATGVYLLTKKLTRSTQTSLLLSFIFITSPYYITIFLSRSAFSEYIAISLIPIIILQIYHFLQTCKERNPKSFWLKYLFLSSLLVISSTIFLLTHNITTLFFIIILGTPALILLGTKVKPDVKSLLLFIPPSVLILSNILFYWIPVITYGNKTNISSTYSLLQTGLQWSPWNVVLAIFPTSSPGAVNTELYLQIGLPTLLLFILFFNWRKAYIHLLIILSFILVCFNVWSYIPPLFHTVQFSLRLLAFIPLLLLFAAKRLGKISFYLLLFSTIFTAILFYQRDTSFYFPAQKSFSTFPTINDWGFYQNSDYNVALKPSMDIKKSRINVRGETVNNNQVFILDKVKNSLAVTFEISLKTESNKFDSIIFIDSRRDEKGESINSEIPYSEVNGKFIYTTCLTNTKDADFFIVNKGQANIVFLQINKYNDSQNSYIDGLYPYTCNYKYNPVNHNFDFKFDRKGEQVILPIYYSTDNRITSSNDKDIAPFGGLLYAGHSYTVLDKDKLESNHVTVSLLANNRFIPLAKTSLMLTLSILIISLVLLTTKKLRASKFINKLNKK